MSTTIVRCQIQFESLVSEIEDGNGQYHTRQAAMAWSNAAAAYLDSHGGGEAKISYDYDHRRFDIFGEKEIGEAADDAGMAAAEEYVADQQKFRQNLDFVY